MVVHALLRVQVEVGDGVRSPVGHVVAVGGEVGVLVVVELGVVPVVVRYCSIVPVLDEGGGMPGQKGEQAGRERTQVVAGTQPGSGWRQTVVVCSQPPG